MAGAERYTVYGLGSAWSWSLAARVTELEERGRVEAGLSPKANAIPGDTAFRRACPRTELIAGLDPHIDCAAVAAS
jgi:hypothetical protein